MPPSGAKETPSAVSYARQLAGCWMAKRPSLCSNRSRIGDGGAARTSTFFAGAAWALALSRARVAIRVAVSGRIMVAPLAVRARETEEQAACRAGMVGIARKHGFS